LRRIRAVIVRGEVYTSWKEGSMGVCDSVEWLSRGADPATEKSSF
jgi:hypothetical protein